MQYKMRDLAIIIILIKKERVFSFSWVSFYQIIMYNWVTMDSLLPPWVSALIDRRWRGIERVLACFCVLLVLRATNLTVSPFCFRSFLE